MTNHCARCDARTENLFYVIYIDPENKNAGVQKEMICLPCYNYVEVQKQHHSTQSHNTQLHPTPPNDTLDPKELEARDNQIKSLLAREIEKPAQLKAGIHRGVYYFGTVVPEGGYQRQAVVTSNKHIFVDWGKERENEIKKFLKLNYREPLKLDALDAHWENKSVREWLYGNPSIRSPRELIDNITKINKTYMWYPDETSHEMIALDILSTYFLPCYEAKGRSFLEAEKGSGKTRQCQIYKLLACNPIMSPDVTKSSFFRIMESTCCTLIIDDFDSIGDDQKNDVLQHYKTGYKPTSKSIRTGDGRNRDIETFRSYGHVVMNNTSGLDPISTDRSVFFPLLKTGRPITKLAIDERAPLWQELRNELYLAALTYWEKVVEAYGIVNSVLSGRQFEISRSFLALAYLHSDDLLSRAEKWLLDSFDRYHWVDKDNDELALATDAWEGKLDGENMTNTAITDHVAAKMLDREATDYKQKKHALSIRIGKALRKLPGIFKPITIGGSNAWKLLSSQKLLDYRNLQGWSWVGEGGVGLVQNTPHPEETIEEKVDV